MIENYLLFTSDRPSLSENFFLRVLHPLPFNSFSKFLYSWRQDRVHVPDQVWEILCRVSLGP